MLPLSVLKSLPIASAEQLVRLFHQSQLEWSRHVGEERELDFGRWISNPAFPKSPDANCLLDGFVLPGTSAVEIMDQMTKITGDCPLAAWSLNPSVPVEQTDPLEQALVAEHWPARSTDILYCTAKPPPAPVPADLRIIPARASFRHYRQLMQERGSVNPAEAMLHLDDSHFDVLLALQNGVGVGSIGVLVSGEGGTIREWFVLPGCRNRGIGRHLLDRALEIATRGLIRHLLIGLPEGCNGARQICRESGFSEIGRWRSFAASSGKDSCKSG